MIERLHARLSDERRHADLGNLLDGPDEKEPLTSGGRDAHDEKTDRDTAAKAVDRTRQRLEKALVEQIATNTPHAEHTAAAALAAIRSFPAEALATEADRHNAEERILALIAT